MAGLYIGNTPINGVSIKVQNAGEIDLSQATASASDIRLGEIAFTKSGKTVGTLKELDTADATASVTDIRKGETAYVNGQKITGTLEPGYDTGDATILASDVLNGKIGYGAKGRIIGTLKVSQGPDTSDATATVAEIFEGKTAYIAGGKAVGSFTLQQEIADQNTEIEAIKLALENKMIISPEIVEVTFRNFTDKVNQLARVCYQNTVTNQYVEERVITSPYTIQCKKDSLIIVESNSNIITDLTTIFENKNGSTIACLVKAGYIERQ